MGLPAGCEEGKRQGKVGKSQGWGEKIGGVKEELVGGGGADVGAE